jgi:ssDNA thymidine ADP-ribosyltransferase, DarT
LPAPKQPKIYHIVHADRLSSIIRDGCLWSDSVMIGRAGDGTTIGMGTIKGRRLILPVACHPGTHVGDYVPFYFCSRSIMLFVIHCANNPELAYRGGQQPIIHIEADLRRVVQWAEAGRRRWAFSLSNAGAYYTIFRATMDEIDEIKWDAVAARDFRQPDIKEGKQAEFLIHQSFPWNLVDQVGVYSQVVGQQVVRAMKGADHRPLVKVKRDWYY